MTDQIFSRDEQGGAGTGWSQVPHGLWTAPGLTACQRVLLGWLQSHTDSYLAGLSLNECRRQVGSSATFVAFDRLEEAGYLKVHRGAGGKPARITLLMAPWRALAGRGVLHSQSEIGSVTSPKSDHIEDQGEDHCSSSLRSEELSVPTQETSGDEGARGAPKPTALGVEAAQAFVEWHRLERGTDPVTAFQGIRSVATAVAKRGYAFDEIVAGLKKTRVMTAKSVQDEIEHARRSPGSAPHSPGAASEPVLGPPIPGEVLRAFQRAAPWLDEFRGWKLDRAMAMDVVTFFVTKRKMSPSEAMIRLAIAIRDQKGDTVEREGLVHWMFKAPVKPPRGEIEDLPAEMERGFINRVWRGA